MSLEMIVKESEVGLVRLFSVDLPPKEALSLKETPHSIATMLGLSNLDTDHVELFDLRDLAGMGLTAYLAEGHGIAEDELASMAARLDQLDGAMLILRSAAVTERPATLTPRAPLNWVATFGEDRPPVPLAGIESASAQGRLSAPPPEIRKQRGSLTTLLLAAVMALSFLAVLWLAFWSP